ncbi:NAD(P)/FAD-dependent oxidoreductase, partial [candidate division KSB1 bacterium]
VRSNRILSQMLDEGASGIVRKLMEENGVKILTGVDTDEILGEKNVTGIKLDDGTEIKCEMVIIGKGVNPNIEITEGTNIRTDWGISVDQYLQTGVAGIYAAGDVALTGDVSTGEQTVNALWPCAVEQGRITGLNMAGSQEIYDGSLGMNSLVFYDVPVISMGVTRPKSTGFEELIKEDKKKNIYKKIVIKDNRIAGLVLVNDVNQAGVYCALIRKRIDISSIRSALLEKNFNFAKILPLIKDNEEKFKDKEFSETVLSYNY